MNDLISRADAIETLGEEPEIILDIDAEWEMHDRWVDAMTSMKSLPSAEAEGDLISRQMAINAIENTDVRITTKEWNELVKALNELSSAEAVQGEWIRKEKEINDCDGHRAFYWYECDQCGTKPPKDTWGHEWHSNFCPNCGARMEGGAEKLRIIGERNVIESEVEE